MKKVSNHFAVSEIIPIFATAISKNNSFFVNSIYGHDFRF